MPPEDARIDAPTERCGGPPEPAVTLDRVGPGGTVASDSAFGVALVSLWHESRRPARRSASPPPVSRIDVAGRAAALVEDPQGRRVVGMAANRVAG